MKTIQPSETMLRSAATGENLAAQILVVMRTECEVTVDLSAVEIMTPSFANALVMNLLGNIELHALQSRCHFENRCDIVIEAMNQAADRYLRGIRLSAQLPQPA